MNSLFAAIATTNSQQDYLPRIDSVPSRSPPRDSAPSTRQLDALSLQFDPDEEIDQLASSDPVSPPVIASTPLTYEMDRITKRRRRTSPAELALLENHFKRNPLPSQVERANIAVQVGMTNRATQVWFQNRRSVFSLISTRLHLDASMQKYHFVVVSLFKPLQFPPIASSSLLYHHTIHLVTERRANVR